MAAICKMCGLPDELCICQEIAKEQQKATISTDRRRYGKIVTKVEGIDDSAIDNLLSYSRTDVQQVAL